MALRSRAMAVVLLATLAWPAPADAQSNKVAVPVRELPPFPEVTASDEELLGVAVEGAADLEEDVVTGAAKREQSLGSVASAVTVIPGERLRRFGYRTLAEALVAVAGLYIVDDHAVERLGIRGVQLLGDANTRILVLVDGSPINEPWSQYVDLSYALPVAIDDVARIEVVRGPVSSVYGTNAFLGIINIVTLEADKAPRAYGRAGVATAGGFGGNAGFNTGTLNRQVRGTVSWITRGGEELAIPELDGGGVTGADGLTAASGALSVNAERLFFHVRGYDRERELPGAPYNSVAGSDGNKNRDRQLVAEVGYNQPLGASFSLAARLWVDAYQQTASLDAQEILDVGGTDMLVPFAFSSTGESLWTGVELRGHWQALPGGKLDLTAGGSTELSRTTSVSLRPDDATAPRVEVARDFSIQGIYLEAASAPLPFLAVTAGARYDVNSLFDNRLSPRGALFLQHRNRVGLKLLYAQGFRNPSIFEAYYRDGERYGVQLIDKDDPNMVCDPTVAGEAQCVSLLRPEDTTAAEVMVWGKPLPGLNLRLSAWRWVLENIIEKRSFFDPMELETRLQYQNLARVVTLGLELEASYRDTAGWMAFAGLAFADVTLPSPVPGAPTLPALNSPALTASAGASTPLLWGRLHLSTELAYVGGRRSRAAPLAAMPDDVDPFLLWNLAVYLPDLRGFDVTIGARNLLDLDETVPAQSDYDRQRPNQAGGVDEIRVSTLPGKGRELFVRVGYRY